MATSVGTTWPRRRPSDRRQRELRPSRRPWDDVKQACKPWHQCRNGCRNGQTGAIRDEVGGLEADDDPAGPHRHPALWNLMVTSIWATVSKATTWKD